MTEINPNYYDKNKTPDPTPSRPLPPINCGYVKSEPFCAPGQCKCSAPRSDRVAGDYTTCVRMKGGAVVFRGECIPALRRDRDDHRLKIVSLNAHITQLKNELAEYEGKPEAFERLRELLRKEKEMRKRGEEESRGLRGDVKMAESQYEAMRHSQEYHIERASNAEKRTEQARATAARFMEEAGKWKRESEKLTRILKGHFK